VSDNGMMWERQVGRGMEGTIMACLQDSISAFALRSD